MAVSFTSCNEKVDDNEISEPEESQIEEITPEEQAVEYKLGARGLRSITEMIMRDAMFEAPSKRAKTFEVSLDYAKQQIEGKVS